MLICTEEEEVQQQEEEEEEDEQQEEEEEQEEFTKPSTLPPSQQLEGGQRYFWLRSPRSDRSGVGASAPQNRPIGEQQEINDWLK